MVPQQVLRAAVARSLAALLAALVGGAAARPARAEPTRIGIIDLGDDPAHGARDRLEHGLAGVQGLEPVTDAALRAALAGEANDPRAAAGRAALAAAAESFRAPDCQGAMPRAEAAVLDLAAAQARAQTQARRAEVTADLRQAETYLLLCQDQLGDRAAAARAATALRALGADPPAGVPAAVWSRYPGIDAVGGVSRSPLAITTDPSGARLWIDFAPAGAAPSTAYLEEGEHVIAAATGARSVAQRISIGGADTTAGASVRLAMPAAVDRWTALAARVRGLRSGATRLGAPALARILRDAGLEVAAVIDARGVVSVWQRSREGTSARHLGNARDPVAIGALVQEGDAQRKGPGIEPGVPLLRESPAERASRTADRRKPTRQEWWVYASIIGAVALGAGVVLASDLGQDRQRIEITFR